MNAREADDYTAARVDEVGATGVVSSFPAPVAPLIKFPQGWKPEDAGYVLGQEMDDGRWWCVMPLTFGRLRIVIAEDQYTAGEHWCYSNPGLAIANWANGP